MDPQEKAFEEALAVDRYDIATRSVYADWLEEQGEDDEAEKQRYCATPEWLESARWMEDFAYRCGSTCINYAVRDSSGNYEEEVYHKITFEDVIEAGRAWLRDGDYWTQIGSEEARSLMSERDGLRQLYWHHYAVITGDTVSDDQADDSPFSCSC